LRPRKAPIELLVWVSMVQLGELRLELRRRGLLGWKKQAGQESREHWTSMRRQKQMAEQRQPWALRS
jgi:hypothetical protein